MKTSTNPVSHASYVQEGFDCVRRRGGADFENPYYPSSEASDAFLIGAWCAYHTGNMPVMVRKSRGYTWVVETGEFWTIRGTVRDPNDQREGFVENIS